MHSGFTIYPSPLPLPPHMFLCVGSVFVWRCFDRQCLCVWAVLAGRRACLVQSWWRAKCSLWVGCAFHSAQPPWTQSRQTAAGGTPLPPSFPSSHTNTAHHCFCATSPFISHYSPTFKFSLKVKLNSKCYFFLLVYLNSHRNLNLHW